MENKENKLTAEEVKPAPTQFIISIKSWRNTDKYECPRCGEKIGTPYLCVPCNIKLKPVINFGKLPH